MPIDRRAYALASAASSWGFSGRRRTHASASQREQREEREAGTQRGELGIGVVGHELGGLVGWQAGFHGGGLHLRGRDEVRALSRRRLMTCCLTESGRFGLALTMVVKFVASMAITIEPTSATPSDAPRFSEVPCRPPASLPREESTDDMMTLPTCDAMQPQASADQRHADGEANGGEVRTQEVEQDDLADEQRRQAALHDELRAEARRHRRTAQREDEQCDRQREDRLAGLQRVEAQHRLQVQRQYEERRLDDERLARLHDESGLHPRYAEKVEVEQRLVAAILDRLFASGEQQQQEAAGDDQPERR